jgi:ATP-dependent DNA helicase RecG
MTAGDIDKILAQGEGLKIEFKTASNSIPSSFYETVVSFSNTDGGSVYLGVSDNGCVEGVDPALSAKLQKDIVSALNSIDCINPPVYVQPILVPHPDGLVISIQIPASSQVHDHKGSIFVREFESDINITENQIKVSDLYLQKRTYFTESKIYPALSMSDLDPGLFQKARDIIRGNRSDHPWVRTGDEQLLRESVLLRKDFQTGAEGLTLAAALIFGKDSAIQSILPAYKVEAMVRKENKDRWDDRIDPPLRTNLIDTYLKLKEFVFKHLPEKFFIEDGQRVDLRDRIFREVIGNLIVHREYTSALSSELIISANQVMTTNPNRALFHGPLDLYSFNPYPKNPNIRKFFNSFGWTDEIGSGVRNTAKYLPYYVTGASPVFIENDVFKSVIPTVSVQPHVFVDNIIKWLELDEYIKTHLTKGFRNFSLDPSLAGKSWNDVLLLLIPTWNQKGTNLRELDWPKNQVFSAEEIKKVPTWEEKSTNLMHKKVRYIISILFICCEASPLELIMKTLAYKNRKTFRDNYLTPLVQSQLLTKTNPENPNDPEQKYVITEKGKLFLGGIDF